MDYRPKIKLSQDEFRVLASNTRIDILKLLDESQLTVSDASRRLEMNKATVHEHLSKLMEVGLVSKEESPRKWVYYRLTWKGRNLLHPERVRVMVTLAVMSLVIVIGALLIASQTPLLLPDGGDDTGPLKIDTSVQWKWDTSGPYDIRLVSASNPVSITEVRDLRTYIESDPTSITLSRPVPLDWARENNVIHLYDHLGVLEAYAGQYLYVQGTVIDDLVVERTFSLRRYLVPIGLEIDLRISNLGIVIDVSNLSKGTVSITFTVENRGTHDVSDTPIEVYSVMPTFRAQGFPAYNSPYLSRLFNRTVDVPVNGSRSISFEVPVRNLFTNAVMVFIDPNNEVMTVETKDSQATQALPLSIVEINEGSKSVSEDRAMDGDEAAGSYWLVIIVAGALLVIVVAVIINKVW
jgi:DNA-binding transcriptional ArsR family regulator